MQRSTTDAHPSHFFQFDVGFENIYQQIQVLEQAMKDPTCL